MNWNNLPKYINVLKPSSQIWNDSLMYGSNPFFQPQQQVNQKWAGVVIQNLDMNTLLAGWFIKREPNFFKKRSKV